MPEINNLEGVTSRKFKQLERLSLFSMCMCTVSIFQKILAITGGSSLFPWPLVQSGLCKQRMLFLLISEAQGKFGLFEKNLEFKWRSPEHYEIT